VNLVQSIGKVHGETAREREPVYTSHGGSHGSTHSGLEHHRAMCGEQWLAETTLLSMRRLADRQAGAARRTGAGRVEACGDDLYQYAGQYTSEWGSLVGMGELRGLARRIGICTVPRSPLIPELLLQLRE
jgi:hypothetical protein